MSRPPSNPTAHLRLSATPGQGATLLCQHCAYEKPLQLPMTIPAVVRIIKAFETLHGDCKARDAAKT